MQIARRRLTRKLIVLFVTPSGLGFALFGFVTFHSFQTSLFEEAERALAEHAAALRAPLEPIHPGEGSSPRALVERISVTETVHGVALYDARGEKIARSPRFPHESVKIDALARRALAGSPMAARIEGPGDVEILVRAEPILGHTTLGALAVVRSLEPENRMIRSAEIRLAMTGISIALLTAALAFWVSRALGRGLGELVSATEQLAAGKLDIEPLEGSRLFELDRLARAFNHMTAALADARAQLEKAGEERQGLERRMLHAQALSVVGQVASSLAHEIGSPLNTILGWARVSATDEELAPPVRRQFETIAAQCERITRIVQRMLSIARPPEEQRELVSLAEVVREVTSFLSLQLRTRGVELRLELDDKAPRVLAVRDLLFMIVSNLCINAEQVQPRGGVLRVRVADASVREPEASETRVLLEIADGGPGIPADQRARVFEPFYSTKRSQGGTGLGLALVADIVRELDGSVKIDDAEEGGALFSVLLPAQR